MKNITSDIPTVFEPIESDISHGFGLMNVHNLIILLGPVLSRHNSSQNKLAPWL